MKKTTTEMLSPEQFERFLGIVADGARVGLSPETLIAACEDFGCSGIESYLAHMRQIISARRSDAVQRALSQPGASSAMASGKHQGGGR